MWMSLIKAEREEEVQLLATKIPEIGEAYGVLKKLSEDEKVRLLYESREKAIRDEQARLYITRKKSLEEGLKKGLKEGRKEGRKEGLKEGQNEAARNALKMGMSFDVAAQIAGLTIEEVGKVQEEMDLSPAGIKKKPERRRKEPVPV
ncbi:MAG: hypothetical protein LBQ42_04585 [Synergistaceae bacterium]|jgi:predicted transposase/invertase (TIGR01784 family)|nr:hypothetical protein [Synergistaceae bacterium]